jgi:hypothetical protein
MRTHNRTHFVLRKTGKMRPDEVAAALSAVYHDIRKEADGRLKIIAEDRLTILVRLCESGKSVFDVYNISHGSTPYEQFLAMITAWQQYSHEEQNAQGKPKQKKHRKKHDHPYRGNAVPDRANS